MVLPFEGIKIVPAGRSRMAINEIIPPPHGSIMASYDLSFHNSNAMGFPKGIVSDRTSTGEGRAHREL